MVSDHPTVLAIAGVSVDRGLSVSDRNRDTRSVRVDARQRQSHVCRFSQIGDHIVSRHRDREDLTEVRRGIEREVTLDVVGRGRYIYVTGEVFDPDRSHKLTLAEPLERATHDLSVEPLSGQTHPRSAIDPDDELSVRLTRDYQVLCDAQEVSGRHAAL